MGAEEGDEVLASMPEEPTLAVKSPRELRLFVREAAELVMEEVTEEAVAEDVTRKLTFMEDVADSSRSSDSSRRLPVTWVTALIVTADMDTPNAADMEEIKAVWNALPIPWARVTPVMI